MSKIEVFEPAMCCSTGVCGVDVDPALAQFAADVQGLQETGVEIVRHRLGHDTAAFAANPVVIEQMQAGMDRLPIVTVDGRVVSTGRYPSRTQLVGALGQQAALSPAPDTGTGGCGCGAGSCSR